MINNNKKVNTKGGAAMLIAVIFFLFTSMTIVLGMVNPVIKQAAVSKNLSVSKESYYLANGATEDIYYRLKSGKQVADSETISLNNASATMLVSNTPTGKQIISTATKNSNVRKILSDVILGSGASFNYGIQSGQGGVNMSNSSNVQGNVYSSGPVTGSGNTINGDVVSSGPSGLIEDINVTGSAYAHTIRDSSVGGNAYYVVKSNTSVSGTSYPNSPDQPAIDLPISDEQIAEFEADALAGGVISSPCPYSISSNRTLGPIKITCNVSISGSPTVTLNGSVWVTGNISFTNSPVIRVGAGLGNKSVVMIADNPANRTTSSAISLRNSSSFYGSGSPGSFIFLISMNNSAELAGDEEAIEMDNSANGGALVLYAPHGLVAINNSASMKEVTAYKIRSRNSAQVIYDTGLVNTLFTSGPGGGFEISNWGEVE